MASSHGDTTQDCYITVVARGCGDWERKSGGCDGEWRAGFGLPRWKCTLARFLASRAEHARQLKSASVVAVYVFVLVVFTDGMGGRWARW